MNKALAATQKEFQSSSGRTQEYLAWHGLFRREFTKFLNANGVTLVSKMKPNHFDISGFFTTASGQEWYFRIEDVRWSKQSMLIRRVRDWKDFTGGMNQYISLTSGADFFTLGFRQIVNNPQSIAAAI